MSGNSDDIDRSELPEEYHPDWEVTIRAYGPDDEDGEYRYDHLHPRAVDEDEAKEKAVEQAKRRGGLIGYYDSYSVVEVNGPYDVPDVPKSVLREARMSENQATLVSATSVAKSPKNSDTEGSQ